MPLHLLVPVEQMSRNSLPDFASLCLAVRDRHAKIVDDGGCME